MHKTVSRNNHSRKVTSSFVFTPRLSNSLMRKLWPPPSPFPLTSPLFLSVSSPPIFLLCFILYFGKYTNIPRHLFIHFASDKVLSFKIGTLIFFTLSHRKDETNFMTWHFPFFFFSFPPSFSLSPALPLSYSII